MRNVTLIALFLLVAAGAFGQRAITGIVTDQNGAVVPGVKVYVTNVDTKAVFAAGASATGNYTIWVPPGNYELNVAKQGFKKVIRKGLEVSTATSVRADVKLIRADPEWKLIPPIMISPLLLRTEN